MANKATYIAESDVVCTPVPIYEHRRLGKNISASIVNILRRRFYIAMLCGTSFCYEITITYSSVKVCNIAVVPKKTHYIIDIIVSNSAHSARPISHAMRMIIDTVRNRTGVTKFYSYSTANRLSREALEQVGFSKAFNDNGIRVFSYDAVGGFNENCNYRVSGGNAGNRC